ncbi:hypothetical protein ZIOFF_048116 [Zingiber officinale]|uniref:glutaredoxin-dependent peroxiredoxin n=1 Tax=Zingiber officinale TaxID=94328 RepID=A0A8J5FRW9_ZINOF|nr:hypothetical protein ZIOFF_048116 [Zingiber officinale]
MFATSRLLSLGPLPTSAGHPDPRCHLYTSWVSTRGQRSSLFPCLFTSSASTPAVATAISIGDNLPDSILTYFGSDGKLQTVTISDLTNAKKAIFYAIPGAFTPTCSQKHLPGFVEKAGELHAKGVDTIACISINNAFMMHAWKKDLNIRDEVLLLSDGNREFTRALEVELDLPDKPMGLGIRSRRYALLAEDGVVKVLNLEDGCAFTFSGAEDLRRQKLNTINMERSLLEIIINNQSGSGESIFASMKFVVLPIAKVFTMCFLGFLMASKYVNILSANGRSFSMGTSHELHATQNHKCLCEIQIPLVSDQPTIIFGTDITHPHPGEDSSSSIAVVVGLKTDSSLENMLDWSVLRPVKN